jgi:hypothetical protein
MYAVFLTIFGAACWAVAPGASPKVFGNWKMNPIRSTLTGDPEAKDLTMRFEPHAKGEVFTLERTGRDGRITTSSTLLYLDGNRRSFEDRDCSGTLTSKRLDSQTVEILRTCGRDGWIRLVRRPGAAAKELIIEITEQGPGGHHSERRLLLEKQ